MDAKISGNTSFTRASPQILIGSSTPLAINMREFTLTGCTVHNHDFAQSYGYSDVSHGRLLSAIANRG